MAEKFAKAAGILVLILALLGFFAGSGMLWGFMNVDPAINFIRILLAIVLLYAGFMAREEVARAIVLSFGVLYVGMGILGFMSPQLFGLLPSGLTGFDVIFHLLVGIVAFWAGVARRSASPAV